MKPRREKTLSRNFATADAGRTTQLHRLTENVREASVELTADDLRQIDVAVAVITVQGAHYPEAAQKLVDR